MQRRLVVASTFAVVLTAAFLPGSGLGSSAAVVRGAREIPVGLADAIHARLGAGTTHPAFPGFLGLTVSLSADGTTALVGAPGGLTSKGAAYIFHVSAAESWSSTDVPTAVLMNQAGPASAQEFGLSVALSADGTTAVVGAPQAGANRFGAIYVFHVSAEDAWVSSSAPAATLTVPNGLDLGESLALSSDGTTLVAGATTYHGLAGGAYVFHVASESAWVSSATPTATLSNAGEDPRDYVVGQAVAISGDGTTALLSDGFNPSGVGAVVFHASAEDAWTSSSAPNAIVSDPTWAPTDASRNSVALSGDGTVALVADAEANSRAGAADVFHAAGAAAWASTSTPTATLTSGGSAGDLFGVEVAVSTDGTTVLATASGVHGWRGAAYVIHVSGEGAWASSAAPTATLKNSAAHANEGLESSALSADGATALVGAPGVRFYTGAADVFHAAAASSWASSSTPNAILADSAMNRCVVPLIVGWKVAAAKSLLEARSCRLGKVRRVHAKGRKGRVVSQSRPPGSRPAVGAKVNVKVAK